MRIQQVPSAVEGACRADVALLFVDASPGAGEAGLGGGHTGEHAAIARACGCASLVVALNKMDAVGWGAARCDELASAMAPLLRSAGWALPDVRFVPISGREGVNTLSRLPPSHPLASSAWGSVCLIDALLSSPLPPPSPPGPLRVPIFEVISAGAPGRPGFGHNVVGGRVACGALRPGLRAVLAPSGAACTVAAVAMAGEDGACDVAYAGDSVEIGLSFPPSAGDPTPSLLPGCVLCVRPSPAAAVLTVRVAVVSPTLPLLPGMVVTLHVGASRCAATIEALLSVASSPGADPAAPVPRPRRLLRGCTGVLTLRPEKPVAAQPFSECRPMGRVVLREGGVTLALGVVEREVPEEAADAAGK